MLKRRLVNDAVLLLTILFAVFIVLPIFTCMLSVTENDYIRYTKIIKLGWDTIYMVENKTGKCLTVSAQGGITITLYPHDYYMQRLKVSESVSLSVADSSGQILENLHLAK